MSKCFTDDELDELDALIARDRAEQGLPPTIEEPSVYRAIATLLAGDDELTIDRAAEPRDQERESA